MGARFQFRNLSARIDRRGGEPPDIIAAVPNDLLRAQTVALGPRFLCDTRDNTFYPLKGHELEMRANLFGKAIGRSVTLTSGAL